MSNDLISYDLIPIDPIPDHTILIVGSPDYSVSTKQRIWKQEPIGPHDRNVDIWYNGKWVPAFFSDIIAGDFFLDLKANLEPGRCFLAASDCRQAGKGSDGHTTFMIPQGCEIVQAPVMKDLPTISTPLQLPLDK